MHDELHQIETFPRCWSFVRGIHRLSVDSPHKGQWRRALLFSFIYAWTNGWANNPDAGDLRRHHAHCDIILMGCKLSGNLQMLINKYYTYIGAE